MYYTKIEKETLYTLVLTQAEVDVVARILIPFYYKAVDDSDEETLLHTFINLHSVHLDDPF